jgi:hypothetical protein
MCIGIKGVESGEEMGFGIGSEIGEKGGWRIF